MLVASAFCRFFTCSGTSTLHSFLSVSCCSMKASPDSLASSFSTAPLPTSCSPSRRRRFFLDQLSYTFLSLVQKMFFSQRRYGKSFEKNGHCNANPFLKWIVKTQWLLKDNRYVLGLAYTLPKSDILAPFDDLGMKSCSPTSGPVKTGCNLWKSPPIKSTNCP